MDTTEKSSTPAGNADKRGGKRAMGRPAVAEKDKKLARLEVVGSVDEIKRIKEIHQQVTYGRQISVSEFIRTLVFEQSEKRPQRGAVNGLPEGPLLGILRNDISSVRKYLQSISDNYNQTVKQINSLPASQRIIDELNEQYKYVSDMQATLLKLNSLIDDLNEQLRPSCER